MSDARPHRRIEEASSARGARYLEVENLGLGYVGRKSGSFHYACRDLSFDVMRGEFVIIVGTSGCGKTTFLEALAGLVPVTDGEIRLGGQRLVGPGHDRSLVFQSASLFPWLTVQGNIEFALRAHRALTREARGAVEQMIDLVGLAGYANRHPRELSGGMKQRVNLARALVTDPELLLLDEPFGALDAQTRAAMQQQLVRVWQAVDGGGAKTAVFVTHDVEEAVFLADRILVFSKAPARLAADIRVNLPRPRLPEHKRTPEFQKYENEVLNLLYERDGADGSGTGQLAVGAGDSRVQQEPVQPGNLA